MRSEILVIVMCVLLLAASSCRRRPPPDFPIPGLQAAEVPGQTSLPPSVESAIRQKGVAIASNAFGVLSSQLGKSIAQAGYTNAIEFCSVHGMTFTKAVGVTNQVVLRRVTHRARNPQNQADTNEVAIIQKFQGDLSKGVSPRPLIGTNKPGLFTYYAPITVQLPLCLSCHGNPADDIHRDTLAQIKAMYPSDEATGFKMGELRGLWSIDFKRSDFLPPPDK